MALQDSPVREPPGPARRVRRAPSTDAYEPGRTRRVRDGDRRPDRSPEAGPPLRSSPAGVAPAGPPASAASREPPDAGLGLLFAFIIAVLVMVGAVVVAGIVDRMWILIPVMCVDFVATFAVMVSIAWLLRGDSESP